MTQLYLAVAPEVENISGHYFADCAPKAPSLLALNDKVTRQVWDRSARLVGL